VGFSSEGIARLISSTMYIPLPSIQM
jgi:hypothetical protein